MSQEQPLIGGITPEQLGQELQKQQAEESRSAEEWPLELDTLQSLSRLNFWLLAFVFGAGSACALLFLMNCGEP